jgi:uncharacterized protein YggU (UPF0235/DUF167 family)
MTEDTDMDIRPIPGGSTLTARVKPRSRRAGLRRSGEALIIEVSAAPIEGRANDQATRVLAAALDVAPGAVTVRHGHASPIKVIEVRGLDPQTIEQRIRSAVEG